MSRDKYSDDHTIRITEGTGTLTIEGNVSISGDTTVSGSLNTSIDDLTVNNDLTVGNDIVSGGDITATNLVSAGGFNFNTAIQLIRVIPNQEFGTIIDTADANVVQDFTWTRFNAVFAGVSPDAYVAISTSPSPSIGIPLDPYLIQNTVLDGIAAWVHIGGASPLQITIRLQAINPAGATNSWSTLQSDTQSVGTNGTRVPLEFDMGNQSIDLLNNSYRLLITTDAAQDCAFFRVATLSDASSVADGLSKFP